MTLSKSQGADFSGADMRDAQLGGGDFEFAILDNADLSGANLMPYRNAKTNLRFAKLRGANLDDAVLREVDLSFSDLTDVDLSNVNIGGSSNLSGVLFCNTTWLDGTVINRDC